MNNINIHGSSRGYFLPTPVAAVKRISNTAAVIIIII